jgi:hypothetical protein
MKINQEITTEQQRLDLIKELQNLEIKKGLSKSWTDLGGIKGYYLTDLSDIQEEASSSAMMTDRNIFATKEQAESSRAYAMLTQLMKEANGDWVADWRDGDQAKYVLVAKEDTLESPMHLYTQEFIALKSDAILEEFLANHEDLIKTFYQIK